MRSKLVSIILAAILLPFISMAQENNYQFTESRANYYLSFWYIHVNGVLRGTTDKFGRIAINLADGMYIAVLTQDSDIGIAVITADNVTTLKRVSVVIIDASEFAEELNMSYDSPFLSEQGEFNMFMQSIESFNEQIIQMSLKHIYRSQQDMEQVISDIDNNVNFLLISEREEREMINEYIERLTER